MMARLGVSPLRSHYPRVPIEPRAAGESGRTDRAGGRGSGGTPEGRGRGWASPPGGGGPTVKEGGCGRSPARSRGPRPPSIALRCSRAGGSGPEAAEAGPLLRRRRSRRRRTSGGWCRGRDSSSLLLLHFESPPGSTLQLPGRGRQRGAGGAARGRRARTGRGRGRRGPSSPARGGGPPARAAPGPRPGRPSPPPPGARARGPLGCREVLSVSRLKERQSDTGIGTGGGPVPLGEGARNSRRQGVPRVAPFLSPPPHHWLREPDSGGRSLCAGSSQTKFGLGTGF